MSYTVTFLRSTIIAGLLSTLAACGGSSSNTETSNLALNVSYPPPNANVGGVEGTSVTGYIETLDGSEILATDIDYVTVNGQEAELEWPEDGTTDSKVRWRTELSLEGISSSSTLTIKLVDAENIVQQVSQVLVNQQLLASMEAVALDTTNNRALVVDSTIDALVAIDLDTGERTVISGAGIGSGTEFTLPKDIALDLDNNRVLLIDSGLDVLFSIDLDTGERSIL